MGNLSKDYNVCLTSIIRNEEVHINRDHQRKARWTNWALFSMYMYVIAHANFYSQYYLKKQLPDYSIHIPGNLINFSCVPCYSV